MDMVERKWSLPALSELGWTTLGASLVGTLGSMPQWCKKDSGDSVRLAPGCDVSFRVTPAPLTLREEICQSVKVPSANSTTLPTRRALSGHKGPPLLPLLLLLPLSTPYSPWLLPGLPGHKGPPLLVTAPAPYNNHTLNVSNLIFTTFHSLYHHSLTQVCPAIKARHSWWFLPLHHYNASASHAPICPLSLPTSSGSGLPGHKGPPLLLPCYNLHTLNVSNLIFTIFHSLSHHSLTQVCPAIKARHSCGTCPYITTTLPLLTLLFALSLPTSSGSGLPGHKGPPLLLPCYNPHTLNVSNLIFTIFHSLSHHSLAQVCPAIKARHSCGTCPYITTTLPLLTLLFALSLPTSSGSGLPGHKGPPLLLPCYFTLL